MLLERNAERRIAQLLRSRDLNTDGGGVDLSEPFSLSLFQYRNECLMKLDACRKRRELRVVYNGKCSEGK